MDTQKLIEDVRSWGVNKGIIGASGKATPSSQFGKLREEMIELHFGIHHNNDGEIIDAIGDCTVVLILLAETAGFRFEDCLLSAYQEIKGRKGRMVDGVFVKEET